VPVFGGRSARESLALRSRSISQNSRDERWPPGSAGGHLQVRVGVAGRFPEVAPVLYCCATISSPSRPRPGERERPPRGCTNGIAAFVDTRTEHVFVPAIFDSLRLIFLFQVDGAGSMVERADDRDARAVDVARRSDAEVDARRVPDGLRWVPLVEWGVGTTRRGRAAGSSVARGPTSSVCPKSDVCATRVPVRIACVTRIPAHCAHKTTAATLVHMITAALGKQ